MLVLLRSMNRSNFATDEVHNKLERIYRVGYHPQFQALTGAFVTTMKKRGHCKKRIDYLMNKWSFRAQVSGLPVSCS